MVTSMSATPMSVEAAGAAGATGVTTGGATSIGVVAGEVLPPC